MATQPGRLAGKRCVVTGAAQGIAWAATQAFLREGAEVMAVDNNEEKLKSLPALPGLSTRVLDVRDREGIFALAKDYQGVNVLFNCAGYVHVGNILDCTVTDWQKSFDVNVSSMFHFIQAFLPGMKKQGCGSIINMSSIVSHAWTAPQRGIYGATKAAVVGLTKGVAIEHIQDGVRCNVVCPGPVHTDAFEGRSNATSVNNVDILVREKIEKRLIGRLPKSEEISGLLVHLASDESWNTTGTVHTSDGGLSLSI